MESITSHISQRQLSPDECYRGHEIRDAIYKLIQKDYPDFKSDSYISAEELNKYRRLYVANLIAEETGEATQLEHEVIEAIAHNKILSENIEDNIEEQSTFGQKIADHIATFGGSWTFIICFFLFILIWMLVNIWILTTRPFDPYPFILLNLILSCLAAIQAPIIMMSQNRQEQKDRQRSEHDYKINLKAEIEIKLLHEKVDHLIVHQSKRLLEIQQIQADYLEDILREVKSAADAKAK